MENNTTPNSPIEMRLEWAPAYKQLPKSKTYHAFKCKDCNSDVMWAVSKKTSKTYLAQETTWMSDAHTSQNGRTNERKFYPVHKCEPDVAYQARYALAMSLLEADRESKLEAGEVVVGAQVEVFKGRKIPKGTTGEVFWIAPQPDQFDVIKAGIKTADGEKVFVSVAHLKAVK